MTDLNAYMTGVGEAARAAATLMAAAPTAAKNTALLALARRLREAGPALTQANDRDLAAATEAGLDAPMVDRLRLTAKVLATVAEGCEQIAAMPDPIGEITGVKRRPTGISVGQMRVPLGVFGIIYESRPNVTIEAASLCHQERQRLHPARRLRGAPQQPGARRAASRTASRKPACRATPCRWSTPPTAPPSAR